MKKIERNGQQINPDFFFNPKQVFKNIEAIMQAIAVSAVKQICKTILESILSFIGAIKNIPELFSQLSASSVYII